MTLTRDDALMPALEPGHHAYRIERGGNLVGIVGSVTRQPSGQREWLAFRPMPSRTAPWGIAAVAATRRAAVALLVDGRP